MNIIERFMSAELFAQLSILGFRCGIYLDYLLLGGTLGLKNHPVWVHACMLCRKDYLQMGISLIRTLFAVPRMLIEVPCV